MLTISNRNNFYNNDMSLLDDMFFDQEFFNHSMQPRYAFEPFRICDARPVARRKCLQLNCVPSFETKRRHPMALAFDMLPFKRSRQNYFDDLANQMVPLNCTDAKSFNSFNIENLSEIEPKNLKIKIDKNSNSLSINYQKKSDNSFYQISETKSLPNFIKEHDLFEKISCHFENGQVQISFPENPVSEPMIEGKKVNEKEVQLGVETDKVPEPEIVSIDLVSEEEEQKEVEERKSSTEEDKNEKIVIPGLE